jgi:Na+-transporting NADH:ubiquinone oxidoreductase subunit C
LSDGGINRWLHRLAEMPNERPAKALFVALAVSLVCALIVSTAAVLLEPFQRANKERDRQQRILEIVQRLPGSAELLGTAGTANIRTDIVELATGHIARSMDPAAYDQRKAATDPGQSVAVPAEHDIAGIRRRAKFAPVTLVERGGRIELIILPVHGSGYASTIYGFLALRGDGNTVVALSFFEHAETPGLGAELDSPEWLAKWPGKSVRDEAGRIRIGVARGRVGPGSASAAFEVDGISGATRTSGGITNMLRFWLGDYGFGPFLERIKS